MTPATGRQPWGTQPGQREILHRKGDDEKQPLRQAGLATVVCALLVMVIIGNALVLGPMVIGSIALFAATIWLFFLASRRGRGVLIGAALLTAVLWTIWLIWVPHVLDLVWPPVRCQWPIWGKLLLLLISSVVCLPAVLLLWRYAAEIANPNWPPPLEARRADDGGVGWPWTRYRGDGEPEPTIIEAPPTRVVVEIEHRGNNGHNRIVNVELPVDDATMAWVCRRIASGASISAAELSGRGSPLSDGKYRELRDAMVDAGWLHWVDPANHQQGVGLTMVGEHVVKKFAALPHPTGR